MKKRKNGGTYNYGEVNRRIYADQYSAFEVDVAKKEEETTWRQRREFVEEDYTLHEEIDFTTEEVNLKLDYVITMSIGVNLEGMYKVSRLVLNPVTITGHRIHPDSITILTAENSWAGPYSEVEEDWIIDERDDGTIWIRFQKPIVGRYIKLHCYYDDRDAENEPVDNATDQEYERNTAYSLLHAFLEEGAVYL